jgi:hypothetical protein
MRQVQVAVARRWPGSVPSSGGFPRRERYGVRRTAGTLGDRFDPGIRIPRARELPTTVAGPLMIGAVVNASVESSPEPSSGGYAGWYIGLALMTVCLVVALAVWRALFNNRDPDVRQR